ncbi:MAG TPA: bifunctional phosphoribosylaminoimidazolecarboxamide formyltransferase/IMP cyclohydrolase, partial [Candidatus Nitrosotenuis sp.]|nr:bifunctional phosphoribosylaminoimidazolecarboxamide formyltransferase/IMP cyclohydrolase [Candidatus Nitrosotenuis sp.]
MVLRRVFLSVYDKTGLPEFAAGLVGLFPRVEILSTGGTARLLRELGHRVTEVSDYTGFPELFGGRVKTLHPRIFGGILYRRGSHDEEAARHQIQPVDLVAVNLYPFEAAWMKGASEAELIEQIDVGGPALLRAAAKNSEQVLVVCRPQDYRPLLAEMEEGEVSLQTRRRLRSLAFAHTATYDALIASALATEEFPEE